MYSYNTQSLLGISAAFELTDCFGLFTVSDPCSWSFFELRRSPRMAEGEGKETNPTQHHLVSLELKVSNGAVWPAA
jgi:hypothetical protein